MFALLTQQTGTTTCVARDGDAKHALKQPRFVLARERVNHSVGGSSGALYNTVRDVFRCYCSVFRDVFRPVDRSRLNAANANSERKND